MEIIEGNWLRVREIGSAGNHDGQKITAMDVIGKRWDSNAMVLKAMYPIRCMRLIPWHINGRSTNIIYVRT